MFRKIQKLLRNTKGVATSLLEATATIAVGATLAGAAITVVTDKVQQARIAATAQDVKMIGDAINNFEKDAGFYPIFKSSADSSLNTSPDTGTRTNVDLLQSDKGDEPELGSSNLNNADPLFDAIGHKPGKGGHSVSSTPGWRSGDKDTLESQLKDNSPGYPVRGGVSFDKKRGWNGPYLATVPPTDAWGNKFKVNALYLDDHRVSDGSTNIYMTFVLSAGPNELIQSFFEVTPQNVANAIGGDDILFRVR